MVKARLADFLTEYVERAEFGYYFRFDEGEEVVFLLRLIKNGGGFDYEARHGKIFYRGFRKGEPYYRLEVPHHSGRPGYDHYLIEAERVFEGLDEVYQWLEENV